MKTRTWALLAGAPALSGCISGGSSGCGPADTIGWNGRLPDGGLFDGGAIAEDDCRTLCNGQELCAPGTPGTLSCRFYCPGGRAPPGLLTHVMLGESIGSFLSAAAEFEAASVHAFWQLAAELEAHGLPGDAARDGAYDEVRHARETTKLALSHGWLPPLPRIVPLAEPRSLEAIAIDNAFEGCGRELFGSVINAWQAEHAQDARVRALMRDIAPDERQHAAFSMSLAETLRPRLPLAARRRVREAQERALSSMSDDGLPEAVRQQLGLMDAKQAGATARRLLERSRV